MENSPSTPFAAASPLPFAPLGPSPLVPSAPLGPSPPPSPRTENEQPPSLAPAALRGPPPRPDPSVGATMSSFDRDALALLCTIVSVYVAVIVGMAIFRS